MTVSTQEEDYLTMETPNRNKPTEPGFYWARSRASFQWYNLIVHIYGDIPYLSYETWDLVEGKIESGKDPSYYFGPKIEEEKVPNNMIMERGPF